MLPIARHFDTIIAMDAEATTPLTHNDDCGRRRGTGIGCRARAGPAHRACSKRAGEPHQFTDRLAALAAAPGVYLMKDAEGKVIYVGKAQILRDRVR